MAGGSSELKRGAGILLPVFSLPSKYGIGAFSEEARSFVDFLKKAGQSYWQVLPLGPTSYGDSPYQSFSTYAGNPYFIDIDALVRDGLITAEDAAEYEVAETGAPIDYAAIYDTRFVLLRKAYDNWKANADETSQKAYEAYIAHNAGWIEDFGLFIALKAANGGKSFLEWDEPLRKREPAAMAAAKRDNAGEMDFHIFLQYLFDRQFRELKAYANKHGIKLIGDIPIYVAPDSADVWANPDLFKLDGELYPTEVAGCPPDAFSALGQLWGNPIYRWDVHIERGYEWWMNRLEAAFERCDILRIDHFRGFESYYTIPYGNETARFGKWEMGPGYGFFQALHDKLGDVPVIAEDLGFLTPEVLKLLEDTGYPGMKVLQFAFDSRESNDYLPHHYGRNCVVYTGTHDNDTTNGWFRELSENDRSFACRYLGLDENDTELMNNVAPAFVRAAFACVANTAIIPMQDWLGLGSEARINTPSTLGGNWGWRLKGGEFTDDLADRIREMSRLYSRLQCE